MRMIPPDYVYKSLATSSFQADIRGHIRVTADIRRHPPVTGRNVTTQHFEYARVPEPLIISVLLVGDAEVRGYGGARGGGALYH